MVKKWLLIAASLLGVMAFVFSAYGAGNVELTFWHHEAPAHRVAAFQQVINLFEKENPNITVKQEVVGWGDAWTKTLAAIKSGTTPDFEFDLPDFNLSAYMAGGIIPVDDIIQDLNSKYTYYNSVLVMYKHDSHYWSVPIWTMPMELIYRPSYLQKYVGTARPPKTWVEALDYAKKLTVDTDGDGKPDIYGIGLTGSESLCTQELVWAILATYGAHIYDQDGNVALDSPETVRGLETFGQLWKYTPPGASGWIWGEIEMNFAAGKIAMMPYFAGLEKRLFDAGDLDFGVAGMPIPSGGKHATLQYPNGVMVFKSAEEKGHLAAVKAFIEFMMRPDINALLTAGMEPGSFVPVTEAASIAPAYWNNKYISAFPWQNDIVVREVKYGNLYGFTWDKVVNKGIGDVIGANTLAEVVQKIIIGGETAEAAAKWGADQIRALSQ